MFRTEEQQALDWNDPMSKKHKTHTHTRLYTHIYKRILQWTFKIPGKKAYEYYRERKCYKRKGWGE